MEVIEKSRVAMGDDARDSVFGGGMTDERAILLWTDFIF